MQIESGETDPSASVGDCTAANKTNVQNNNNDSRSRKFIVYT